MTHCPACNGDELARINGEWVECPGCGHEDLERQLAERIADLERKLERARAALNDLRGEADSEKPDRDPQVQLCHIVNWAEEAIKVIDGRKA